jgi:steroid delta-isomerase-like uncharacterized protein
MSTDVKSVVLDWTQAMDRHDPDAFAAFLDENCVFTNGGTGKRYRGREAWRQELIELLEGWSDLHINVTSLLIDGDSYSQEWVMTGVHTGDLPGAPATGRSFRVIGADVGRLRDGKILEVTEYWNPIDFLRQVGILPGGSTGSGRPDPAHFSTTSST